MMLSPSAFASRAVWIPLLLVACCLVMATPLQAYPQFRSSLSDEYAWEAASTNTQIQKEDSKWDLVAGGEATLFRAFQSNAVGLTTMTSDGASREDLIDRDLRFPSGAGYRVWLGTESPYRVGFRASYWAFEPGNGSLQARPAANGFGRVNHPEFGDVDISSGLPSDLLSVSSSLSARTSHGEGHVTWMHEVWMTRMSLGLEYADLKQGYHARLVNDTVGLVGQINNQRNFAGVGPTIGLGGQLEITSRIAFTGQFRSSILLGRTETRLDAGEDLDLPQPLITQRLGTQDRVMNRFEGDLGILVHLYEGRRLSSDAQVTLEAQNWLGVGNGVSQEGNLGLFGIGLGWTNRF